MLILTKVGSRRDWPVGCGTGLADWARHGTGRSGAARDGPVGRGTGRDG